MSPAARAPTSRGQTFWPRCILHADLDAFYASVEQLDRPELQGRPVLVGGSPQGRGVVAACSYEARAYGVRSAMPMRTAVARCPGAVVVPPRFGRYRELSQAVMDIFRSMTPLVEPLSLDEAYLDLSDAAAARAPEDLARALKERVRGETGLTVSVGVATSKSVAKIASDLGKPNGLVVVQPGGEREFLAPLPVRRLGGIGPKTEERLGALGIGTLGELAAQSDAWLQREFGKRGPELGACARGEDRRPVAPSREVKSISAERTFARDLRDPEALARELDLLCERVAARLESALPALDGPGRTVTLKLRLADFTTFTRSVTPAVSPTTAAEVTRAARGLLEREMAPGRAFRLLGVGVSGFAPRRQPSLFDL